MQNVDEVSALYYLLRPSLSLRIRSFEIPQLDRDYLNTSNPAFIMAPNFGLVGYDSVSSFHPSKKPSPTPPTKTKEEAEKVKATMPKVMSLDARTCTVDEIVEAMKVSGGVVIRNAVPHDKLDLIESKHSRCPSSLDIER